VYSRRSDTHSRRAQGKDIWKGRWRLQLCGQGGRGRRGTFYPLTLRGDHSIPRVNILRRKIIGPSRERGDRDLFRGGGGGVGIVEKGKPVIIMGGKEEGKLREKIRRGMIFCTQRSKICWPTEENRDTGDWCARSIVHKGVQPEECVCRLRGK